jgi:hypothetical protein
MAITKETLNKINYTRKTFCVHSLLSIFFQIELFLHQMPKASMPN